MKRRCGYIITWSLWLVLWRQLHVRLGRVAVLSGHCGCQSPYKHMIAAVKKLPPTLTSSAATITQSFQLPVSPANAGGPAQLQLLARQTVKLIFCCAAVSTLPKSAALRCKCRAYQQVKCVVMSTSLTREPRPRFLVTIPMKVSNVYCGTFHNILISM